MVAEALADAKPQQIAYVTRKQAGKEASSLPPYAPVSHVAFVSPSSSVVKVAALSRTYELIVQDTPHVHLLLEADGPPHPDLGVIPLRGGPQAGQT